MTSPPDSALTEAERAAFLQSIARVRSAVGRALRAAQANAVQGAAAHGTGQAPDATESAAQAAVDFIAQLHQGLDTVAEQARANGPKPACQAGCAHCCHLRVEATDPEVLHIAQHLQTLPSADPATTLRRLQQHVAEASVGPRASPAAFSSMIGAPFTACAPPPAARRIPCRLRTVQSSRPPSRRTCACWWIPRRWYRGDDGALALRSTPP